MSSRSHSMPTPTGRPEPDVPWIFVAALIAGVGFLVSALLGWSGLLLAAGTALLLGGLAGVLAVLRRGADRERKGVQNASRPVE